MENSTRILLPTDVSPSNYKLCLTPDLANFTFEGEVAITLSINNESSQLTMHCAELEIIEVSVFHDNDPIPISETTLNAKSETLTVGVVDTLNIGQTIRLEIKFKGVLNDRLLGFYRSRYLDIEGNEKHLAATQFESTDARRAFPCWDEPDRKATFDVTLIIPNSMVAVSNMDICSESNTGSGLKAVTFNTTPIMSTYLLAFIVGDLSCIEKRSDSGTLIRVWTTKGKEHQGRFALETSLELLDFYNNYFGIAYPLPKLDHLAIPDFAAGAMENWGAITYREVALLIDPTNSSTGTKQIVASIISHEMAHMWFGDLVTMRWWNDLWLNESFASWMGDKAVDAIHPDWDMWTQFLNADTASAFNLDGLANSHPIEQEVNNPAEIGQLFDAISYSKGGSVLRMLEDYIGAEEFRVGIGNYLNNHSYSNAETSDLWSALSDASGQPVGDVMDSWIKQTGFPVLSAIRDKDKVSISQERFLYENITADSTNSNKTKWFVPIKISGQNTDNISSFLMKRPTEKIALPAGTGDWFKINPDQTGFYRVLYEPENITRLESAIRENQLASKDRLGLQGDAYALCKAGYAPVSSFLRLARAYTEEPEAPVLSDLAAGLRGIDNLIDGTVFHEQYRTFCRSIFKSAGEKSGWDKTADESHMDSLFRSTALSNLGHYQDEKTLGEASRRFALYQEAPDKVHPDIRSVVFALTAQQGDRHIYDSMWNMEKQSDLQEEKVRFHSALASFSDNDLLYETLERSISDDIRVQDSVRIIVSVSSSRKGRSLAWDFIRENWIEIDRRYGDGGFALMRLVSLVSGFSSTERIHEIETFFSKHSAPAAERTIEQAKERIRLNSAWLDLNLEEIGRFLGS
mgnify:CR=1 FL=1